MRLQKYIALCGIASRRKAEDMIKAGRVQVNDNLITEMGCAIDENVDTVKVDNAIIAVENAQHYYAFNKPENVITSAKDEKDRKCVLDYFDEVDDRLFTVGRLDYGSSGLILVTNDGEFANRVTHPKYESWKTYEAFIAGHISKERLQQLKAGIVIEDYKTAPAKIKLIQQSANSQFMQINIREGRNRQIRKMVELSGARVTQLERTAIGPIQLGNLAVGKYRELSRSEIEHFYSLKPKQKRQK